jgi:hypothetical protein
MNDETKADEEYTVRKVGRPYTKDYRVYFERRNDGIPVSPFHDVPLYHDRDNGILNMVVEVPRWSNAKFEVCISFCFTYSSGIITIQNMEWGRINCADEFEANRSRETSRSTP